MHTPLGRERLKTGEMLEIGVVSAPDADWQSHIEPFLAHKGPGWNDHIHRALSGPLDALETLFYVGRIGEELVTQVMIVGHAGAGILGHVYTRPEHRRKGAYNCLMAHQMKDVARRGYHVLTLSTGFDSHPYRIYHSHGFRGLREGSGQMRWQADLDAEARLLSPAAATVRPLEWTDWASIALLAAQPVSQGEGLPRSLAMPLLGQGSLESGFVQFKLALERGRGRRAMALVRDGGIAVGWASAVPDERWFGQQLILDVHTHPHFDGQMPRLIDALELGDVPVTAYVHTGGGARRRSLQSAGFARAAVLERWLRHGGEHHDVEIWRRGTGSPPT
jgi:hypothetical protein